MVAILTNPAYTGKFYAFTTENGRRRFTRPQEDWIEIEGITPAVISPELFDAAQRQLQINRTRTVPTTKNEYLLRGHIRCRQCGRAYTGSSRGKKRINWENQTSYRCLGKLKIDTPLKRCPNRGWNAKILEALVWEELARYLSDPDLILKELEKKRQDVDQLRAFETELRQIERQTRVVDRDQQQLLQWALKGFPAEQVESECKRLNKARETLRMRKKSSKHRLRLAKTQLSMCLTLNALSRIYRSDCLS